MHHWEDDLVRDLVAQAASVRAWTRTLTGTAVILGLLWAVAAR